MRILFFVLLLANVVFLAWSYVGSGPATGETQLVGQQVNPEAIRLLAADQVAVLAAERAKAAERPSATPPPKPTVAECLDLGPLSLSDVPRAEQLLEPLGLGARLAQRRTEETASHWVFMPPQGNRQAANRKAAELKNLGVEDFFVIQDDPKLRFAISLGVFKSEEAARARLAELRARGVRSAQVGARETTVQKVHFVIRDVPDSLTPRLNELRQGFPGSELKGCVPEEKRAGG